MRRATLLALGALAMSAAMSDVMSVVMSAQAQVLPGRTGAPAVYESHRIQVVNRSYGPVLLSRDGGKSWSKVGTVLKPNAGVVHRVQDKEFTASDWAPLSSVAATAVNAIHLKFDQEQHAGVLTLQPREFLDDGRAKQAASYMAQDASIYTDIPAGHGIFAEDAPFVGNPLELVTTQGAVPVPKGYVPRPNDILQIRVLAPVHLPDRIEFENRFGGAVMMIDHDGTAHRIAQVLRPFMGIGRFTGSQFAKPGVVRANHPGVLCISTAPTGQIGGFQIIPSVHASHPDLDYVRAKAVWLVVGPVGGLQQDLEGTYPLFRGYFRPVRSHAKVRIDGGPWVDLPVLAGLKEGALKKVTHLAVYP